MKKFVFAILFGIFAGWLWDWSGRPAVPVDHDYAVPIPDYEADMAPKEWGRPTGDPAIEAYLYTIAKTSGQPIEKVREVYLDVIAEGL